MKKISTFANKSIAAVMLLAFAVIPFGPNLSSVAHAAAMPTWDASGSYVVNMEYQGTQYAHDMTLVQDNSGSLTGNGGSPVGSNTYTWTVTSGTVSGDTIDFMANYTATPDAVTPQTSMHVMGTIASDGTISGTWSDNYQGGDRSGALTTSSGAASAMGSLAAEDFGVVNYDTGMGMLKGYTAGFGLTDATFENVQSVIVKLYSGSTLLQTNTATAKVGDEITGSQISSPFDVSGNFDYATDGYWTNARESEYGQSMPATKVVATVMLENGKTVTAENTNLTGDGTTVFPGNTTGTINGDVTGGQAAGVLAVTSVTPTDTTATADGTFENGWVYTFNITVPSNETALSMKFADWTSGSNTLPVANNMRISSVQANNSGATVALTAANTYSTPALVMTGDLNPSMPGKQVQVKVEVAVPSTTVNGSYNTSYGVKTI